MLDDADLLSNLDLLIVDQGLMLAPARSAQGLLLLLDVVRERCKCRRSHIEALQILLLLLLHDRIDIIIEIRSGVFDALEEGLQVFKEQRLLLEELKIEIEPRLEEVNEPTANRY